MTTKIKLGNQYKLVIHKTTDRYRGYFKTIEGTYTLLRGRTNLYLHDYENGQDLECGKDQLERFLKDGTPINV